MGINRRLLQMFSALIIALALPATAEATTWTVTTPLDPASPTCPSASNCSLRGALADAASGDTVMLPAGDYKLTQGELTMTQAVTIVGVGASSTRIDAQGASRVLDITTTSSDPVGLTDLTITGGAVTGPGGSAGGGGIYIAGAYSGTVTLTGTTVTGNDATITSLSKNGGGGIHDSSSATVVLVDSTVSANTATLTGGTSNDGGGGIYSDDGDTTLTNSHVDDNTVVQGAGSTTSNDGGGGIYSNGEDVTLTGSTVDGNSATVDGGTSNDGGGGIYNNGQNVTSTDSQVDGNHLTLTSTDANNGGGGVYDNGQQVTLTSSSADGNTASMTGTAYVGGVGLFINGGPLIATGSTIADNTGSATGTGVDGGGAVLLNGFGETFSNDTLSGNSITVTSTGSGNGGGAIFAASLQAESISDSTIADNAINEPGGGILADGSQIKLKNAILADNSASPTGNCATVNGGSFASDGFNLDSGDTCGLTQTSDHTAANAVLGPLADNGGTMLTQALGPGSAAINAGSCTDADGNPVPTDERGEPRPDPGDPAGECDIGAFEVQPTANTSLPSIRGNPTAGETLTCQPGTWSNQATVFTYQWKRNGVAIPGATGETYVVQFADDANMLTCTVTGANGDGPGPPATSAPVLVGNNSELNCPKPSGRLNGTKLGPLALGESLRQAEKALKIHSAGPYGFTEFCLYAGFGIRAATPSTKLVHKLPHKKRAAVKSRLVIALTPNRFYALDGILPGSEISTIPKARHLEKPFVIGKNTWYLVPGKAATGLLKVRQGEIFEVGLANKQLIGSSRKSQKFFLQSFGGGSASA